MADYDTQRAAYRTEGQRLRSPSGSPFEWTGRRPFFPPWARLVASFIGAAVIAFCLVAFAIALAHPERWP